MCQWDSGETAPCDEETGMMQRGSSGGRSRPSSALVKQLQERHEKTNKKQQRDFFYNKSNKAKHKDFLMNSHLPVTKGEHILKTQKEDTLPGLMEIQRKQPKTLKNDRVAS